MGIRIGPVRLSSRGARLSVGPRIARINVGAGRTTFSSGAGPFSVSTGGRRRRRRPAPRRQPTYGPVGYGGFGSPKPLHPALGSLIVIASMASMCLLGFIINSLVKVFHS